MNYRKSILIMLSLTMLGGCTSLLSEDIATNNTYDCPAPTKLAGGWQKGEVTPEVQHAAELAMLDADKKQTVSKVLDVSRQVVSGINYHLIFESNTGQTYSALIYRNLQGDYTVNEVNAVDLDDAKCAKGNA